MAPCLNYGYTSYNAYRYSIGRRSCQSDSSRATYQREQGSLRSCPNHVRVSYRVTSALVVGTYALLIASNLLFAWLRPPVAPPVVGAGAFQFDPCAMWDQMPATELVSNMAWFGSFTVVLVQGLRNRSAPRWLAVLCLVVLGPTINYQLWNVKHCLTTFNTVGFWVCTCEVALMCLHQIVQRPRQVTADSVE